MNNAISRRTFLGAAALAPAALDFPLVDYHVHLDNVVTLEKALEISRQRGVKFGIVEHAGTKENKYSGLLSSDADLKRYLDRLAGKPVFKGIQAEGLDWMACFSKGMIAQLDYVLSDALTFPEKDGKRVELWRPGVKVEDPQDFMERYTEFNVQVIARAQIDILANPTFLPACIEREYDALWTPARMKRIIAAAARHGVAIEINSRYRLPRLPFLELARRAGVKFAFGSNIHGLDVGKLDYCVEMAQRLDLRRPQMFAPGDRLRVPRVLAAATIPVKAKKKPADAWATFPTRTLEQLEGLGGGQTRVGRYGGRLDKKRPGAGFFRTLKDAGRWWLVDPDGCLYLNVGVCSVTPGRSKNNQAALKEKFGSEARWAEETVRLLRAYSFNGTGGWSAAEALRGAPQRLPYTLSWNFMGGFGRNKGMAYQQPGHLGYPGDCIPVFHPEFEAFCDEYAGSLAPTKDDPFLVGHFSDNELPAPADLLDKSLALDPKDPNTAPGYEAARRWLEGRSGPPSEHRDAFREHVFERYLALTTRAIRRHDPNHLCLGPRLHGAGLRSPGIVRAAGRHLDVIAVNIYWQWAPEAQMLAMWEKEAGKPFLVTEFYAKGDDAGFPNTTGAGWIVPTQRDRALFYQHFTLALLESRQCVGWHWFKYIDNDPEDLTTDPSNRDSNKGIVSIRYEPYKALLEAMAPLNRQVYALADYFDRRKAAGGP